MSGDAALTRRGDGAAGIPAAIAAARRSGLLRRLAARLLCRGGERRLRLFGADLVVDPRWELGYILAARHQRHSTALSNDVPVLLSLALLLQPGDTFLDIGANAGLYSAVLGRMRHVRAGAAFHAFEVNPDTARRLRASIAGTGIAVHCHGLSDRNGEIPFRAGVTSGLFRASDAAPGAQARMLPVRRLDDCGIDGRSLVMKIDVEGHEYHVLNGASATFASGRVKAVCIDGYDDPRVAEFLRAQGFRFHDARTLQPLPAPDPAVPLLAVRPPHGNGDDGEPGLPIGSREHHG